MTEWILSSSILILIVIALRTVFKGKISLRLQYAIWGLVLLRLLIPVSLGSTDYSVANLTAKTEAPSIVIQSAKPGDNQQADHPVQYPQEQPDKIPSQNITQNEPVAEENGFDLSTNTSYIIWGIGFICVAGLFLLTNLRFKKRIMGSRYGLDVQKNNLDVYATGEIDTPCLFGIRNPAIYVTYLVADNQTLLRHTLEHEATHHRHGDHIWAVLRCVCLAIHWYNPLVWWAAFISQRDAELACDEATIKRLGEGERAEYGRTLIGMTCQKKANVLITATTMNSGKSGIKERIFMIAKKPKMALYTFMIVVLVASIAVGCTFTGAGNNPNTAEKLAEYLREYSYEQVKDRMELDEVHYIGETDNYSLVYCSGMGPNLFLYRYEVDGNQIVITDQAEGEYAISNGLSVNHIMDGEKHIYFGTVSDYHWMPASDSRIPINWKSLFIIDENGTEYEIEMADKEGYLCVLDAPMEHFDVIEHNDTTGWSLTMASYLNQGYLIHETEWLSEIRATEDAKTREDILDEIGGGSIEETQLIEDTAKDGAFYKAADENKVCIAVLPTGISVEGGDYRYIIPEDQEVLLEYYTAANASAHTYTKWDSSNLRSGWWIVYQDVWWQVTESGAMFGIDNETFDGICIDADDAKDLYEFCDAEVKAAGMVEPVRSEELAAIKSATLYWNGTHTVTDEYALNKLEKWFSNSRESSSVSCWFTAPLVLELENGTIRTITIATDSCAYYMTEGVAYGFGEITDEGIEGNEEFYSLFAPAVIYEKSKEGMDAVNEYMIYLNWSRYANQYGVDETFALMDMIEKWAAEEPTFNRFGGAIGWSTGLDGAYADYYAAILARLYELAPSEFAWACLGNATDAKEQNTLELLAYNWNITTEEARAKLQADIPQN